MNMIEKKENLKDCVLARAVEMAKRAYCPYSNFAVGAVIVSKSGEFFGGCNVENACSNLGICAERVALSSAIAAGQSEFEMIAIYHDGETLPYPCGACRQVLYEFGKDMKMLIGSRTKTVETTLDKLLPNGFNID